MQINYSDIDRLTVDPKTIPPGMYFGDAHGKWVEFEIEGKSLLAECEVKTTHLLVSFSTTLTFSSEQQRCHGVGKVLRVFLK